MVEIIPAILPKNFQELESGLSLIKNLVKNVQIDICDGKLTSQESWPYYRRVIADQNFLNIIGEKEGFPFWEELDFEFDLMVKNPEEAVSVWLSAGASRIVVHLETVSDFGKIRETLDGLVELGVAINIDTDEKLLEPILKNRQADFVQCMGIARIGFQGEPFDSRVIEKIKRIRKLYPEIPISVDGGVSLENAGLLVEAGANRLISGSAIFESGSIRETIKLLEQSDVTN